MRKLDTSLLGGFPFDLDDITWQNDGMIEAIEQIWRALGANYILRGCVVTEVGTNTYDISAGAVVMDGEVYLYAGQSGVVIPELSEAWFVLSATLDATGAEQFEDLVTRNAYVRRVAALTQAASAPAAPVCALRAQNLAQRLAELTGSVVVPWAAISLTGDWALGGLPYIRAEYRREGARIVRIRGAVNGSASTGATLGVLPVGFRPVGVIRFPLVSLSNPAVTRIAQIDTSGNIQVTIVGTPGADDVFDLSQVPAFEAA
jgi:hypothetical protein